MSKILETYIRSVLNERPSDRPELDQIGLFSHGMALSLVDMRGIEQAFDEHGFHDAVSSAAFAHIEWSKPWNPCDEAMEINYAICSFKGLGNVLYRMAAVKVDKDGGNLLIPDRKGTVSQSALDFWDRMYVRLPDDKKHKLDNALEPETPPRQDDCIVYRQKNAQALNYAYDLIQPGDEELYKEMERRFAKFVKFSHARTHITPQTLQAAKRTIQSDLYDSIYANLPQKKYDHRAGK